MRGRRTVLVLLSAAAVAIPNLPASSAPAAQSGGPNRPPTAVTAGLVRSDCWPTDNGDPVLTGLALSTTHLDISEHRADLAVRVTAQDTGGPGALTGVRSVTVGYSLVGADGGRNADLRRTADGSWVGSWPFYRGAARPGARFVSAVYLTDWAGNERDYSLAELTAMGLALPFHVATSVVDAAKPRLSVVRLSSPMIDARRRPGRVTVSARVSDDLSGVQFVEAHLLGNREQIGAMRLVRGTRLNGTWRASFRIGRWQPPSRYELEFTFADNFGHITGLSSDQLKARHLPYRVRVLGAVDTVGPVVSRATVTPTVFDVTASAASARVRVVASDDRAGIRDVEAFLIGPHSAYSRRIHLRLASGTDRHGRWTGTIPLPACTSPAGRWHLYLKVTDRAWNWAPELRGVTVQIAALDHVRPVSDDPLYPRTVTSPVRFTFSEDVTNLSADTVEVFEVVQDERAGTVGGVWSCTDVAGGTADCATGAVRAAAFTPDVPWVDGREYRANFARDGTAGVMDLVGNPLESELTMYFDVRPNG